MALLIKGVKLSQLAANRVPAPFVTAIRHHWNKDWKAGKYPETEEERKAAAKKYGMHPSEYQPYPNDGTGYGDYPKMKDEPHERRDLYYPWDMPEHKRNFGEPIHIEYNIYSEDRYGTPTPLRWSKSQMAGSFCLFMGTVFALYFYLDDKKMFRPVLPKQLPSDGRTHYTFEPKN
uniref:CSON009714 protein n=1 Tax=Culicoides sonorensis TaxID=179676 RepID=A0A336LPW7_CULSO